MLLINWFFGEIEFAFRTLRSFITGRGAPTLPGPLDDGNLLAQAEEQREVWEAPLSATFTDEPEPRVFRCDNCDTRLGETAAQSRYLDGSFCSARCVSVAEVRDATKAVRATQSSDAVSAVSVEDPPAGDSPSPVGADSNVLEHECGEGDDYWQGAPEDKRTCRVCNQVWVAEDAGPLDIEWVRFEPSKPLTWESWAVPAIQEVLAAHHPDMAKTGEVWCFDRAEGLATHHERPFADWQEWREHVGPLIAAALRGAP